jgi:sugar/nucleoside kinase (ribokinase family)
VGTDLVVAAPTFLDMTFVGLDALPAPGEERFAGGLVRAPGGGGITAVAAARLGISVALAAPLGEDDGGRFLRERMAREGIAVGERRSRYTPTTVVLPVGGEGAMITVDHGVRAYAAEVAHFEPRIVVATLQVLHTAPPSAARYVVCGDDDAAAYAGRPPKELSGARALFLSPREVIALSGEATLEDGARKLAADAQTVLVSLGDDGVLAVTGGERVEVPAFEAAPAVDRTGTRDLHAAAHAWAEVRGASPEDCIRWAELYATLAARTPTPLDGAVSEPTLLAAGAAAGLKAPGS